MEQPIIELPTVQGKAVKKVRTKAIPKEVKRGRGKQPGEPSKSIRPYVNVETASRIGERCGRGLTVEEACLCEVPPIVDFEWYNQLLARRPELRTAHRVEMAKFVDSATKDLRKGDAPGEKKANGIQFLLERRRPQEWAKKPDVQITNNTLVAGLPRGVEDSLVKRINELAAMPAIPIEHHKTKE